MSVFEVILVCIFLHFDWTRKDSVSIRIQSECGKIRTRITQNRNTVNNVIWCRLYLKLSNLIDKGRWNIVPIATITETFSLPRHGWIDAPSMELVTACTKFDFPSPPLFGKPFASNKILANKKHSYNPMISFISMLSTGKVLSTAFVRNKSPYQPSWCNLLPLTYWPFLLLFFNIATLFQSYALLMDPEYRLLTLSEAFHKWIICRVVFFNKNKRKILFTLSSNKRSVVIL